MVSKSLLTLWCLIIVQRSFGYLRFTKFQKDRGSIGSHRRISSMQNIIVVAALLDIAAHWMVNVSIVQQAWHNCGHANVVSRRDRIFWPPLLYASNWQLSNNMCRSPLFLSAPPASANSGFRGVVLFLRIHIQKKNISLIHSISTPKIMYTLAVQSKEKSRVSYGLFVLTFCLLSDRLMIFLLLYLF